MFDIRVLRDRDEDGGRLGRITIGEFKEVFACGFDDATVEGLTDRWCTELRLLIQGRPAVALVHDPRFAWILYREGDWCFVQQILSLDGNFNVLPPRETESDDGSPTSEWKTDIHSIQEYLGA